MWGQMWKGVNKIKYTKIIIHPKSNLKFKQLWYGHKKVNPKYLEEEIWKHMLIHLVYKKLDIKFEQFR
jgi:hypothetical protein